MLTFIEILKMAENYPLRPIWLLFTDAIQQDIWGNFLIDLHTIKHPLMTNANNIGTSALSKRH